MCLSSTHTQIWTKRRALMARGRPLLTVSPEGPLRDLTMGGIFFESREPPAEEFSFEDLEAKFPEGMYRGTGRAKFTHDVPAAPTVNAPEDGDEVQADDVIVEWDDVTQTVDGDPVTITGYEVIVTKVEHDDPHGFSRPVYDVHVPPDRNALPVPEEFFEPGTEYELEVLALETSGNQTITVSSFTTE